MDPTPLREEIDTTTFTRESLLILLGLLRIRLKPGDRALFAYVSAAAYSSGEEGHDKWLSKGISQSAMKDFRCFLLIEFASCR